MANLNRVIKVTGDQWNHIVEYGSIVIGGTTYTTDENTIFLIDDFDTFGPIEELNYNAATNNSGERKTGFNWDDVNKYKFVVVETTHSAGKVTITVPVSFIPLIANTYTSVNDLPTYSANLDYRFTGRMYTSSNTSVGNLVTGFALITISNVPNKLYIYTRNDSNAARVIKIYFVGRNAETN